MAATSSIAVSAHSDIRVPSHSRDLSTISSATFVNTNTTAHSQPTEPLLRPTTPQVGKCYDVSSHRPRSSERSLRLPRWSQSHVMSRRYSAAIVSEKDGRNHLERVKLLRRVKNGLAILMGKLSLCICCCLGLEKSEIPPPPFVFVFENFKRP